MSSPYIGEIRMFAGNFAPVGWSFCNGAIIPISQNDALFTLIGTTYGGDGQETFALPTFRARCRFIVGLGSRLRRPEAPSGAPSLRRRFPRTRTCRSAKALMVRCPAL